MCESKSDVEEMREEDVEIMDDNGNKKEMRKIIENKIIKMN